MQLVCGVVALVTALSWWKLGGVHRWRGIIVTAALVTVAIGWPISEEVGRFAPLERFKHSARSRHRDSRGIQAALRPWHLVSLALSFVTVTLAGIALALAAKLPNDTAPAGSGLSPGVASGW